jgi:uncharacterized damage-inducible protein DinB
VELLNDDGLILYHLQENFTKIKEFIYRLPDDKLYQRYSEDKWSIKEILVHIIDEERIFARRALRCARSKKTGLHGFEKHEHTFCSDPDKRSLDNIFEEYEALRHSTIAMFNGFSEEELMRSVAVVGGIHNRTIRALAYHIAGHELWHIKILKERHLNMPTGNGIL